MRKRCLQLCRMLADLHSGGGPGTSADRALHLYRRMVLDEDIWRALLTLQARRGDAAGLEREWKRLLTRSHQPSLRWRQSACIVAYWRSLVSMTRPQHSVLGSNIAARAHAASAGGRCGFF